MLGELALEFLPTPPPGGPPRPYAPSHRGGASATDAKSET